MRVLALIFSLVLSGCRADTPSAQMQDTAHQRVVSTSLCGDAYILSMLEEGDIAALSWQSGDKLSTAPETFKNKPKARDDIEVLLALNPTLVVFGPDEGVTAKPLLDKRGIKFVNLVWGENFVAVDSNMKFLADKIKTQNKNHLSPAFVPGPPAALHQASRDPGTSPGTGVFNILYLTASGATAGPGTYVDAAIEAAGGTNIITTPGWQTPSVESLVSLDPDLIVTSFFKDGYASVNEAGLRNKVLQDKLKAVPQINVPGKLWPCAGPGLYEATDIIKNALEGLN